MIIGLTGRNGSGKGAVAELLVKRGFAYHSLSDIIRAEIRKTGADVTREKMIVTGKKLRQEGGLGVLAEKILTLLNSDQNAIVDSIRNPGEVRVLKSRPDFALIAVHAEQGVRFERCRVRARENDPITLNEFIRLENAELKSSDESAQQLIATEKLANAIIENSSTLEQLERELDATIKQLFP